MKRRGGFTLVEILLAIAIFGLIMMVVFVATRGSREKATIAGSLEFNHNIQNSLGAYAAGWWAFDGIQTGQVLDSSGHRNHANVFGATLVDGLAQLGKALSFDGNDYLKVNTISNELKLNTGGTISAWFRLSVLGTGYRNTIVMKGTGLAWANLHYVLFMPTGRNDMLLSISNGSQTLGASGPDTRDLQINQWYHIVATWNNSKKCIYLNGDLEECINSTIMPSNTITELYIGACKAGSGGFYFFRGILDDVRIYNQPMNLSEIQKQYAQGLEKHKDLAYNE